MSMWVDSVNGSDAFTGIEAEPKRTLAGLGTLSVDTTYYLVPGSTFNEALTMPNGTAGIVFDKSTANGPLPIITGDGITANDTTVALRGATQKIRNIHVEPTSHATLRNSILLATTSVNGIVEYCSGNGTPGFSGTSCVIVCDSTTLGTVRYCDVLSGNDGIRVDWASGSAAEILYNKVRNVKVDGIRAISGDFQGRCLLLGNDVSAFGDDGIDLFNASGVKAIFNEVYSPSADAAGPGSGIKAGAGSSVTNFIWFNYIHDLLYGSLRYGINTNGASAPDLISNIIVNANWGIASLATQTAGRILNNTSIRCVRGLHSGGNNVTTIMNNILDGSEFDLKLNAGDNITGGGNCLKNQSSITGGTYSGTDLLATDPQLRADYSLPSTSPCKGAGTFVGHYGDFYGQRFNLAAIDIGAVAYIPPPFPITSRTIDADAVARAITTRTLVSRRGIMR